MNADCALHLCLFIQQALLAKLTYISESRASWFPEHLGFRALLRGLAVKSSNDNLTVLIFNLPSLGTRVRPQPQPYPCDEYTTKRSAEKFHIKIWGKKKQQFCYCYFLLYVYLCLIMTIMMNWIEFNWNKTKQNKTCVREKHGYAHNYYVSMLLICD